MDKKYSLDDLKVFCSEKEAESLVLEFKSCNELRPGKCRDKNGKPKSRENIIVDMTKDVTSFLNSAGGTIIYGVAEKNSRAESLDLNNAYKYQNDPYPEKMVDWCRAHIQPPPNIIVYTIPVETGNSSSPWLLAIQIPQGDTAYMAKDRRFYNRVGETSRPMEQYDVVDTINRSKGAYLESRLTVSPAGTGDRGKMPLWVNFNLRSKNYLASEYGAYRLLFPMSINYDQNRLHYIAQEAEFDSSIIDYPALDGSFRCNTVTMTWGANEGKVILPHKWNKMHKRGIPIVINRNQFPAGSSIFLKTELFTSNAPVREQFFIVSIDESKQHMPTYQEGQAGFSQAIEVISSFFAKDFIQP